MYKETKLFIDGEKANSDMKFTAAEVFKVIELKEKPYAGIMNASTYFMRKKRFLNGTIKDITLTHFFKKFGFEKCECNYQMI